MISHKINASCQDNWRGHNACFLNISMGQKYHEGEKFASLLNWVSQNFDYCIINVCETLHRHNLIATSSSAKDAYNKARKLGDGWLQRNQQSIAAYMSVPYTLNRWDDWRAKSEYSKLHNDILSYYDTDPLFKASIQADIQRFTNRIRDKEDLIKNIKTYKKAATLYLLEEAAIYILMVREYGAARVYPAPELECLKYLKSPHTPESLKGIENSIHINLNFKRRKTALQKIA